jgi:hypothetical protein
MLGYMGNQPLPFGQIYQTRPAAATPLGTPTEAATVLVVEDDPILLSTLAYNLGWDGYRVLSAADGEKGLAVATVDVHVSWLRAKLQDAGVRDNVIQTVYGNGYRFIVPNDFSKSDARRSSQQT